MRTGTPWVAIAALATLAATAGCGRDQRPADSAVAEAAFFGAEVPTEVSTPALKLVEHGGRTFDLAAERGRVVLVFFGYTNCPDICPTTLANWSRARKQLGADTARVRFVFVTVDPARDTPEIAQRYARQFDPSFVGLSGSPAQLDSAQEAFRVSSFKEPSPAHAQADPQHGEHMPGYTMAHASRVFVIDRAGRWRLIELASAPVETLVADIRRLLREG